MQTKSITQSRKMQNKGITLIALVITIIILLILAAISINALTESGLFGKAKQAKIETERQEAKEQVQLAVLASYGEDGKLDYGELETNLKKIEKIKKDTIPSPITNDSFPMTVDVNGFNFTIQSDGTVARKKTDIGSEENPNAPIITDISGASSPNIDKIEQKTYVTWNLNETGTEYVINDTQTKQPDNWYDYENGKWANIKTTNETEELEAYWVWIPRYEYVVPTSTTATQIEVKFIPTSQKQADEGYTIHPAFTNEGNGGFGDLDGIWVAKFESTCKATEAYYGGGDDPSFKVQVIPNEISWRYIKPKTIFEVSRRMTNEGEVLYKSNVNSHLIKNIEWGAVAILSQSKYGIYNSQSISGDSDRYGVVAKQIWKCPLSIRSSSSPPSVCQTGLVGDDRDGLNNSLIEEFNSKNGPRASTTGTIYGIYGMAGRIEEVVAGCIDGKQQELFGISSSEEKYVDLYTNNSYSDTNYSSAKIGDATRETAGWNKGSSNFIMPNRPIFYRGRIWNFQFLLRY